MGSSETPPSNESKLHLCTVCSEPCTTCCSKCKVVYYCTPEHNRAGWKAHKPHCYPKKIKAVLLPVDDILPRLITLAVERIPDGDEDAFDDTRKSMLKHLGPPFRGEPPRASRNLIETDGIYGPRLPETKGYGLTVFFRDEFTYDGSATNKCLPYLAQGQLPRDWRGPMIVIKELCGADEYWPPVYSCYGDMTLEELGPVVKFYQAYGRR